LLDPFLVVEEFGMFGAQDRHWADSTIEIRETAEQALVSKTARVVEEVGLKKIGSDHVETVHDKIRRQQVEIERLGPDGRPLTTPRA
jgi:stress response protein YsnF